MLVLPLAYDGAWTTATSWHVPIVGESIEMLCERRSRVVVDGWGTAQIPLGTFDCLRVDSYDTLINTTYASGIPVYADTSRHRAYTWWTREHGMAAAATSLVNDTSHASTQSDCYWVLVGRTAGAVAEPPVSPSTSWSEPRLPGVIGGSVLVRGHEAERFPRSRSIRGCRPSSLPDRCSLTRATSAGLRFCDPSCRLCRAWQLGLFVMSQA
jgi:hypothetical protein